MDYIIRHKQMSYIDRVINPYASWSRVWLPIGQQYNRCGTIIESNKCSRVVILIIVVVTITIVIIVYSPSSLA